jgi:hypothetical protein
MAQHVFCDVLRVGHQKRSCSGSERFRSSFKQRTCIQAVVTAALCQGGRSDCASEEATVFSCRSVSQLNQKTALWMQLLWWICRSAC